MNGNLNSKPSQFQIFKGASAMRIQLDKPVREDQTYKTGCLYLQVAPSKPGNGQTGYDWENKKISCKIGVNDITKIIHGFKTRDNVDLFHEFNGDTKSIKFGKNARTVGSYFLNIQQNGSSGENKVSVSLSPEEVTALQLMLEASLPLIHNWY